MAYTTQALIETRIKRPLLVESLDDDGDGVADEGLLDSIIAAASLPVDAMLEAVGISTPASSPPAIAQDAALIFACELISGRRLQADQDNRFKKEADQMRARLARIARGEESIAQAGTASAMFNDSPTLVASRDEQDGA